MKRIVLVTLCLMFVATISQAQYASAAVRKELKDIDMSFLTDEPSINVVFIYDSLKVGRVPEEDYILKKVDEYEKEKLGGGEQWRHEWFDNRIKFYEPEFLKGLNGHLAKFKVDYGIHPEARYTMLVHVTDLYPGIRSTWSISNPELEVSFYFIETDTNVLLESFSIKAEAVAGSTRTTDKQRITWIYQNAGKFMGYNVLYQRGYGLKKKK